MRRSVVGDARDRKGRRRPMMRAPQVNAAQPSSSPALSPSGDIAGLVALLNGADAKDDQHPGVGESKRDRRPDSV
jgi:hypothetical protein